MSCMHTSFGYCIQHLKAKIMRCSSTDPEDVHIQHAESFESVKKSEIPTKGKYGEAQRIVNKVHKEMSFAVVAACLISVLMDPFFFYIGLVDNNNKCFRTEKRLQNVALISRPVADILFLMDMIFHINKASKLVASDSKRAEAGGGKSKIFKYVGHVKAIANKLSFDSKVFITVDFFAILPIPQVIGAFWYFTAIQRQLTCWYQASCSRLDGECRNIYCDGDHRGYSIGMLTMINKNCSLDDGAPFSYGMFHDALKSGYMEHTISGGKLSYFMWWGLKNLSTNGTDLQTSTYLWENCFAILVAILGMVLFAYLIGHMQVLDPEQLGKMNRLVEMAEKASEDKAWLENNIYTYLKPVIYTQKEFIFQVGEPLDSVLYIVDGTVIIYTTSSSPDSPSRIHQVLGGESVYGRVELIKWNELTLRSGTPEPLKNLPTSTRNVRCHTKVEGFVLTAKDLKTLLHALEERHI